MKIRKIIILLIIGSGIIVILYPFLSTWYNEQVFVSIGETYERKAGYLSEEAIAAEWKKAEEYNNSLAGEPVQDPFIPDSGRALPENYLEVLNLDDVMGRIEIPQIESDLPIYHGTSEEVLKKGVGHIEGTSLPLGQNGHAILTGHTGLPDVALFTKLDQLDISDVFYVTILNKTFEYKVDQINVILPDEFSLHEIEYGNYITLVTCTPYGINSHRLLVRGEFTREVEPTEKEAAGSQHQHIFILTGLILIIVIWLIRRRTQKRKKLKG